jgi:hypothetical protein
VPQTVESQVIRDAVQVVASHDEQLGAGTCRIGVFALYESPPLRADSGRGKGKDVRGRVYCVALCYVRFGDI